MKQKIQEFLAKFPTVEACLPVVAGPVLWKDATQPFDVRVKDLVSRMSLAEKAAQMLNRAPAIPRLDLPAYNYWNECLHGVARAGAATVFPQAIGMAATWNVPLLHDIADTIATEARAKHNDFVASHNGDSAQYFGLTFWTPNINIFRDPRWGRGQETYGEDTFLTSRLGVAFIRGLQGDDPKYVKAMACAKHFAVHSGPEPERHMFDAEPPERDLYETYLPHFEAAVREGKVGAVMGAYNSVDGQPACASTLLLTDILRQRWGFEGHVVSDCGAIYDIFANHKTVPTDEEASARAVEAGCDLCCGQDYAALTKAVRLGLITEHQVDISLGRVLEARFRLGMFDPPEQVPYARIPITENDTPAHAALALRAARESIVLLKNDGVLPLNRAKIKRIAVIGTNADSVVILEGNYNGHSSKPITILAGIKAAAGPGIQVSYEPGSPLALRKDGTDKPAASLLANAVKAAAAADVVIYVGGLSPRLEGEEMRVNYIGFAGGDRTDITLPAVQEDLLKALYATGKPVVCVNCSGSAVALVWEAKHLPAIVQAWYPGGPGGQAVGEVLFGDVNPAGRLPVTFYRSTNDLPPFDDYAMANRTYRYFTGKPLYAFGHGLSYTARTDL
jgi:beta-glucosidase